jgi:hypothetical protein
LLAAIRRCNRSRVASRIASRVLASAVVAPRIPLTVDSHLVRSPLCCTKSFTGSYRESTGGTNRNGAELIAPRRFRTCVLVSDFSQREATSLVFGW